MAIVAGERRISFAGWADEARRVAAGLVRLGLRKGDIVTVQLPNWPELCVLQIALARIGAVIQPMHMVYREREIESMLRFCDSRAVILAGTYHGFGHAAAVAGMRARLPDLEWMITTRDGAGGEATYESLLGSDDGLDDYLAATPLHADDVLYLNFTSGTEGAPRNSSIRAFFSPKRNAPLECPPSNGVRVLTGKTKSVLEERSVPRSFTMLSTV